MLPGKSIFIIRRKPERITTIYCILFTYAHTYIIDIRHIQHVRDIRIKINIINSNDIYIHTSMKYLIQVSKPKCLNLIYNIKYMRKKSTRETEINILGIRDFDHDLDRFQSYSPLNHIMFKKHIISIYTIRVCGSWGN